MARKMTPKTFRKYAQRWAEEEGHTGGIRKADSDHNVCPTCRGFMVDTRLLRLAKTKFPHTDKAAREEAEAEIDELEKRFKAHKEKDINVRKWMNDVRAACCVGAASAQIRRSNRNVI